MSKVAILTKQVQIPQITFTIVLFYMGKDYFRGMKGRHFLEKKNGRGGKTLLKTLQCPCVHSP